MRRMEMLADGTLQPGVILMDAQMPGLSGMELIAELRSRSLRRASTSSAEATSGRGGSSGRRLSPEAFNAEALRRLIDGHESPKRSRRSSIPTSPWSASRF